VILVDSGPLVAILDRDDQHHRACVAALKSIKEPMATLWPVLTEVMYFLRRHPHDQEQIWKMIAQGPIQVLSLSPSDLPGIRELMIKYSNRPMDLADAALIRVAEREGIRQIFTVDRGDFSVYRLHGSIRPRVIP
jgi:predicted nucleic acid-binding protein